MPLPLTRLDKHTFDQLFAEGNALATRTAPRWTDYNRHDPGITFIEMFAWLTETDLYQLDRTPAANYWAFLDMLGIKPRQPQPAETILILSTVNQMKPLTLPHGIQLVNSRSDVIFQTTQTINVSPLKVVRLFSGSADNLLEVTASNLSQNRTFPAMGSNPEPGDALYIGFDQAFKDKNLDISLYLWSDHPEEDRVTKQGLIEECQALQEDPNPACLTYDWSEHYSVHTTWEYYTGPEPEDWTELNILVDDTRALTLSGSVRLLLPGDGLDHAPGGLNVESKQLIYFIRCRMVKGKFDCAPEISRIEFNAVPARHACDNDVGDQPYRSSGQAAQRFQTAKSPVLAEGFHLDVLSVGSKGIRWNAVSSLEQAGPHDCVYLLVPETGEIFFGDGLHGRVPPVDSQIQVSYKIGGGVIGNVPAQSLVSVLPGSAHNSQLVPGWEQITETLSVAQPFAAAGGENGETLTDALARVNAWLEAPVRAITLDDIETLAKAVPGVPVARAHAIAEYQPDFPCIIAPGCISVVIVPNSPEASPFPSPRMCQIVKRYLERRKAIATELHVIGPSYAVISVQACLHILSGVDGAALTVQANDLLDNYFHPLHGGLNGQGWPMGQGVYRSEVMSLLNRLPGVTFVDAVSFQIVPEAELCRSQNPCAAETTGTPERCCGNPAICPHSLLTSGVHQITVSIERKK